MSNSGLYLVFVCQILFLSQVEIGGEEKLSEEQTEVNEYFDEDGTLKILFEKLCLLIEPYLNKDMLRLSRDQWMFLQQAPRIHLCLEFSRISNWFWQVMDSVVVCSVVGRVVVDSVVDSVVCSVVDRLE